MCYSKLKIGDAVPLFYRRGIIGAELASPRWHALRVAPLKETAVAGMLNRAGVRAFFPREKRDRVLRGKRFSVKHPQVTQIVYAKFRHQPHWDVLQERRVITGVFCIGTTPIILPADAIRQIQGLPTAAEKLRAAKEELMRVVPGERVEITDGPMAGFFVDVTESRDGRVWWQHIAGNGMPIKGEMERDSVRKLDVD